jgi:hypothetical protein
VIVPTLYPNPGWVEFLDPDAVERGHAQAADHSGIGRSGRAAMR